MESIEKIKAKRRYTALPWNEDGSDDEEKDMLSEEANASYTDSSTEAPSVAYDLDVAPSVAASSRLETRYTALYEAIDTEVQEMLVYALDKGREVPEVVGHALTTPSITSLLDAHAQLCHVIAPATPETIKFIQYYHQRKKRGVFFSPIPVVRYFIGIAILAIIGLISSGLSADVNTTTLSKGILNNSGFSLLKNLMFLCSASLIGVVFFLLSKLTKEVKEATFSKSDITYYWAMLIMGMLSGLIMSEMIVLNQTQIDGQTVEINRLLFALLGGFSSEVVYSILQALMNKLSHLFGNKN